MSQLVKFGDVVESIAIRVDDPKTAGVDRYVGLEHLDSETVTVSRWGSPSDVEATKLRFFVGDVIYGRRRAYQRKLGRASFEGICSAHALVLRGKAKKCLSEFLPYFLQSERFHKRAIEISVGSLSPTINWSTLKVQEFAFPSLDEQARIVELMTAVDEHLDALRSQLEVAKGSRAAVLHQLLSAGGDDWVNTTLGCLINVQSGFAFSANDWRDDGYPVIKINNVRDGKVTIETCSYIGDPIPKGAEKFRLSRGDLLITLTGEIGATGTVHQEFPMYLNQRVGKIVVLDESKLSLGFISTFFNHLPVRQEMWSLGKGNAQLNISPKAIQDMKVHLPPLAEQDRIVEIVSSMDDVIQATEQAIAEAKVLRTTLLNQEIS